MAWNCNTHLVDFSITFIIVYWDNFFGMHDTWYARRSLRLLLLLWPPRLNSRNVGFPNFLPHPSFLPSVYSSTVRILEKRWFYLRVDFIKVSMDKGNAPSWHILYCYYHCSSERPADPSDPYCTIYEYLFSKSNGSTS